MRLLEEQVAWVWIGKVRLVTGLVKEGYWGGVTLHKKYILKSLISIFSHIIVYFVYFEAD